MSFTLSIRVCAKRCLYGLASRPPLLSPRWQPHSSRRYYFEIGEPPDWVVVPSEWRSSNDMQLARVSSGSGPPVRIYLHNMKKHFDEDAPLWVYLPPKPHSLEDNVPAPELPNFLRDQAVATIGYRWMAKALSAPGYTPLWWPAPVHDVGFAWKWIQDNMQPTDVTRRNDPSHRGWDANVVGTYWGAGLAVSLALHACIPRPQFGIRSVMAYNGIYNWSAFLPEHRFNRDPGVVSRDKLEAIERLRELASEQLAAEHEAVEAMFGHKPANLFDPWASPVLFFSREDIGVPRSFGLVGEEEDEDDLLWKLQQDLPNQRASTLTFPPKESALQIPVTKLFYTPLASTPQQPSALRPPRKQTMMINSYESQARDLMQKLRHAVTRKEVMGIDDYWKLQDTPEGDELLQLPLRKVTFEALTDREYDELCLDDYGAKEEDESADNAIRTVT